MKHGWALAVVLLASAAVAESGLQEAVGAALQRLRQRPSTCLLPGLLLERTRAAPAPTAAPTGLVARTEALFDTHTLRWSVLPDLNLRVAKADDGQFRLSVEKTGRRQDGRTFGLMKRRLQMLVTPLAFKLGIIVTLLVMLTIFALKGLTVGLIILVLTSAGLLSKLKHHGHPWEEGHYGHKDIHVHVHPEYGYHGHDYGGHPWHRSDHYHYSDYSTTPPWKYLPDYNMSK